MIRQAHELGVTLFDTAELYNLGKGLNEDLVGEALEPIRGHVQIATKFGFTYDADGNSNGHDSSPANIQPRGREQSPLPPHGCDPTCFYQHRRTRQKNITPAQHLALAWLLAQGNDIVAIPGTRSLTRLKENLGAADVSLSTDDLARIHDIVPNGAVGARYIDELLPSWT